MVFRHRQCVALAQLPETAMTDAEVTTGTVALRNAPARRKQGTGRDFLHNRLGHLSLRRNATAVARCQKRVARSRSRVAWPTMNAPSNTAGRNNRMPQPGFRRPEQPAPRLRSRRSCPVDARDCAAVLRNPTATDLRTAVWSRRTTSVCARSNQMRMTVSTRRMITVPS